MEIRFLNTINDPFLFYFNFLAKMLCKLFKLYYHIGLKRKTAFRFNFGPWEVPNLENVQFYFHAFLVGALGLELLRNNEAKPMLKYFPTIFSTKNNADIPDSYAH